jgi:hypothetical protein
MADKKPPIWVIVGLKCTPEEIETRVLGFCRDNDKAERLGLIRGSTEGFEVGTFDITLGPSELGVQWREWFLGNGVQPAEAAEQIRSLATSLKAGLALFRGGSGPAN